MKNFNIGIIGLGTVGQGVVRNLLDKKKLISDRCKKNINIVAVSARNKGKKRSVDLSGIKWLDDPLEIVSIPEIDLIVELIGGSSGIAFKLSNNTLKAKKHLVTANKALIAKHGIELLKIAEKNEKKLFFEAAVAGGIPVLKVIREGLSANKNFSLYGIMNGTCNYILTEMKNSKLSFNKALHQAQKLGYAESNPAEDISGADTVAKLSILTTLSFGCHSDIKNIYMEGIENIEPIDIIMAKELGYKISLLGMVSLKDNILIQRVHPCLVKETSILSKVEGVLNAIVIKGDASKKVTMIGEGAGSGPTASAVISDIIDIARGSKVSSYGVDVNYLKKIKLASFDKRLGRFYIRLLVRNKPGTFADISGCFKEANVSISSLNQQESSNIDEENIPIIITTYENSEENVRLALNNIEKLNTIINKPKLIRIENI